MSLSDQIFQDFCRGKIEDFYTYIYPDLLVYAGTLLKNETAFSPEDCVQEAVENSYFRRHTFNSSNHWKAFLVACIRNRAISLKRHSDAQNNYMTELSFKEAITPDALLDYIEVETRNRLFNAIASLPEDLKEVFNLSFEKGLKNPEIANRLGIALITVKKRKARLIARLRLLLGTDSWIYLSLTP